MYGQLLLTIAGPSLTLFEKLVIKKASLLGGLIFFDTNYVNAEQFKALIEEIKTLRSKAGLAPLLLAVDYEGGMVKRFGKDAFTSLPSAKALGGLYKSSKQAALQLAHDVATVSAFELSRVGINLIFAPVMDLDTNPFYRESQRAYDEDASIVSDLTQVYLKTMQSSGFQAVGKHFPGFGLLKEDTHKQQGIIENIAKEEVQNNLLPFKLAIENHSLDALMLTHGVFSDVDRNSVPFSKKWIGGILRNDLKFDGLVFSDCIMMQAAINVYPELNERVAHCLLAGCDYVLATITPLMDPTALSRHDAHPLFRAYYESDLFKSSQQRISRYLTNDYLPPQKSKYEQAVKRITAFKWDRSTTNEY